MHHKGVQENKTECYKYLPTYVFSMGCRKHTYTVSSLSNEIHSLLFGNDDRGSVSADHWVSVHIGLKKYILLLKQIA